MVERKLPRCPAPMVGREAELGRLRLALDDVVARRGGLVLVSGEPGIGKTRLLEELAADAEGREVLVASGRVDEDDGYPPYWPWVQLMNALSGYFGRTDFGAAMGGDAGVIAAIFPEAKDLVTELVPPPPLGPAETRFRLHQAVVDFLGRLTVDEPLVVVLEDLHWADVASLELATFVAARLATLPVLMVVSYRSVDAGDSEAFENALASLARRTAARIALTGLTEHEVARFMSHTVEDEPAEGASAAVHSRTEGNPFLVGELVRLLESEGLLSTGSWEGLERAAVPSGVRDVVRRRLARLPDTASDLLVLGAVIGRDFDLGTLSPAADLSESDALERIGPAVAAGLVLEVTSSVGRFRFSHALIRDTVYSELSALRRTTLHARVGTILELRQGAVRSDVAELAWHFFQAAPVAGPDRGLAYMLEASGAAWAAGAYERTETDLRRALRLIEMMPAGPQCAERELYVQNRLAALLTMTRGPADADVGRACARARALAQEAGETTELIATLAGLAFFHFQRADFNIVLELAEQVIAIGERHANTTALAIGHSGRGLVLPYFDRLGDARESLATALPLASSLDRTAAVGEAYRMHPLVVVLTCAARYAWLCGDDDEARTASADVVRVARQIDHPYSLAIALYTGSLLAVLMEDAAQAERLSEQAGAVCVLRKLSSLDTWCRLVHGWALTDLGRYEEGVAQMQAAMDVHRTMGSRMNTAFFLSLLAHGEHRLGHDERALVLLDEGLHLAQTVPDRLYEADIHRRRGELLAHLGAGRAAEARASFQEAIAVAEQQGAVAFQRRAQTALASLDRGNEQAAPVDRAGLSARESELLGMVGRGLTDKEIAAGLMISLATVRSHLERIRDKTGRRRRPELSRLSDDLGLTGH